MKRRELKEILRPIVRESLSDYLRDTEQDTRALQAAHPQLDLTTTAAERGIKSVAKEGVISELTPLENTRLKFIRGIREYIRTAFAKAAFHQPGKVHSPESYISPQERAILKMVANKPSTVRPGDLEIVKQVGKRFGVKLKFPEMPMDEASTANGNPGMGYQTPYAFSNVGKDAKKRKIAQSLGYKIVEKNRLKEEVMINVTKAVPLGND